MPFSISKNRQSNLSVSKLLKILCPSVPFLVLAQAVSEKWIYSAIVYLAMFHQIHVSQIEFYENRMEKLFKKSTSRVSTFQKFSTFSIISYLPSLLFCYVRLQEQYSSISPQYQLFCKISPISNQNYATACGTKSYKNRVEELSKFYLMGGIFSSQATP